MAINVGGYNFEGPYRETGPIKHQQGLYVILDERRDRKSYVIDVGESEDLRERVDNHDRKSCWEMKRQGTLSVAILYTPGWSGAQRRTVESQIRDAYSPSCGVR